MSTIKPPAMKTGQLLHAGSLAILLPLTAAAWQWSGAAHPVLFWTAVGIPIFHQIYVWIAWRLALQATRPPGAGVFRLYVVCFFVLFGGRFVSLLWLGWQDTGSLQLPMAVRVLLTAGLALPGLYTMYSVFRWFGMVRAAGADHFQERYRSMPLVQQGIFRFTNNGMYVYAFLLFWAIAVAFDSSAALIVAAFSHAYIWVHYHATEKPDMQYLYADPASNAAD